jgi:hypothetical protein
LDGKVKGVLHLNHFSVKYVLLQKVCYNSSIN